MDNFIIHLHLYITNKDAESTAFNNIKNLKEFGFKILITSPFALPDVFYQHIDYFLLDKENQIFQKKYKDIEPIIWWNQIDSNMTFNFVIDGFQNHGLAVLRSMIKGSSIAKALGYEYIIRFEYDDLFGSYSLNKILEICTFIKDNNLNFYLYKNQYNEFKKDISTHLMFYKSQNFLNIFETIKDENDYISFLEKIGTPNRSLILEEFIYRAIDMIGDNIHYENGLDLKTQLYDTMFNTHQAPLGVTKGVLSDVMRIKRNFMYDPQTVCVVCRNVDSRDPICIYFDIFDHNENLLDTITSELNYMGEWKLNYIYETKDVGSIKIRHGNDQPHHKTFLILNNENGVIIKNVDLEGCIPEIIFKT